MKIQAVNFNNHQKYYPQPPKAATPALSATTNAAQFFTLDYPKPEVTAPKSTGNFLKEGGFLIYDNAFKNDKPYTGKIIRKCSSFQTVDCYKDGIKHSIIIYDKEGDGFVVFKKENEKLNKDLSKNILWKSETPDKAKLFESYDDKGILCQTEFFGETGSQEKMFTRTTFDTNGVTILHNSTEYTENGNKYFIETDYKNGKKHKRVATATDGISIKGGIADKIDKKYDEDGKLALVELKKPKYYTENDELWASSDKKVKNIAKETETDYNYKTLNLQDGAAAIRNFIYEEHPNTVRTIKGNTVSYTDGFTGELYATEVYKNGKNITSESIPLSVENMENGNTATTRRCADRIVLVFIKNKEGKPIKNASFEKVGNRYKIHGLEHFENGKRIKTESFLKDGKRLEHNFA